jgi:hypothetical protein
MGNVQTKRALLNLADLGGLEEGMDPTYRDMQYAQLENMRIGRGEQVAPPAPWQTDAIHVEFHFNHMNSPEFDSWEPQAKAAMMEHVALHLRRHNPAQGLEIAQMLAGVQGVDPAYAQKLIVQLTLALQNQQQQGAPQAAPPQGSPVA